MPKRWFMIVACLLCGKSNPAIRPDSYQSSGSFFHAWLLLLLAYRVWVAPGVAVGGEIPPLPDHEGFAAPFAGISHDALCVAGGANFPEKKPWAGGQKVWYQQVFLWEKGAAKWQMVGQLPRPLAYGVSVTHRQSVLCFGGSDSQRHYAEAFQLEWRNGTLSTTPLPALPKPLANACGALVGDTCYIAGGQEKPEDAVTSGAVYRIDLAAAHPQWQEIEPVPGGGRILAVAAGHDGAFWLIGGVDLLTDSAGKVVRKYLQDGYRYAPQEGWKRIADLPRSAAAAPSPAPCDAKGIYILGGDDGSQVGTAPEKHQGFAKSVLRYDPANNQWQTAGELAAPRVTVPCIAWDKTWIIPSGEVRPGIRSPEVTTFMRTP